MTTGKMDMRSGQMEENLKEKSNILATWKKNDIYKNPTGGNRLEQASKR